MITFSKFITELTSRIDNIMTLNPTSFVSVNSDSIENIRQLYGDKEFDDLGTINAVSVWPTGVGTPDKITNISYGFYILKKEDRHFLIEVDDHKIIAMIELI